MDLEHEKRLTEVESRSEANERRIVDLEKRQDKFDELNASIKTLAIREKQVEGDVKEIKADVKSLTSKPAQKWDKMIESIITLIVAGIVGCILAKIGL